MDDNREAPSYVLMEKLEGRGAMDACNDPHVPVIRPTREHAHFAGQSSQPVEAEGYALVVISTAHEECRAHDYSDWDIPVADTRNGAVRRPRRYYQA